MHPWLLGFADLQVSLSIQAAESLIFLGRHRETSSLLEPPLQCPYALYIKLIIMNNKQHQQRRYSPWLKRAVGNQRLLLVSLFMITTWIVMGDYRNDQDEDQNFLNNVLSRIGLGHIGSRRGYFSPGARVGRGRVSAVLVPVGMYIVTKDVYIMQMKMVWLIALIICTQDTNLRARRQNIMLFFHVMEGCIMNGRLEWYVE